MMNGVAAIVLAAGSGSRMQSDIKKQYMQIEDKPLVYYALQAFEASPVEKIILVVARGDEDYTMNGIVKKYGFQKVQKVVAGGAQRSDSVLCGLRLLAGCEYVLIHDAARPFLTMDIIRRSIEGVKKYKACVVGMPVKDTVKICDREEYADYTPPRNRVWLIQTPQSFEYNLIRDAYEKMALDATAAVTDDAMVVETYSDTKVKLIQGSYENIKITTPEDLEIAEVFIKKQTEKM